MPLADYVVGGLLFGAMLALVLAGAWAMQARRLPGLVGATRVTALGLIGCLGVLAVHLLPLALGVLSRVTVLVAAVLWVLACLRVPAVPSGPARSAERGPPVAAADSLLPRLLAAASVAALVVYVIAAGRSQLIARALSIDAYNFHLPGVAEWMRTGSLWQIDVFLPAVSPGHYPNNGDVFLLSTILPWDNDFLSRFTMYPVLVLLGFAVYALVRELGVNASGSTSAATLLLAVPATMVPALVGELVDSLMLFGFAAGLLFLVRHWRTQATSDLVLAGLALGLAFGTKWYAVSAVPTVLAVWVGASLIARHRLGTVVRQAAALTGLVALSGGIWLLRNLVESANPVFPVKVELLGVTLFDAPPDRVRSLAGFTLADYVGDGPAWRDYLWPQAREFAGLPTAVLLSGALFAVGLLAVRRFRGSELRQGAGLAAAALVCAGLLALAYSVTPYTAGGPEGQPVLAGVDARYGIPALLVATPLAAWGAYRVRWGPVAFGILGLAGVLHGVYLAGGGGRYSVQLSNGDWAIGVLATILLGALAFAGSRLGAGVGRRPIAAAAAGAALLVLLAAAGHEAQQRFNAKRLQGYDTALDWFVTNVRGEEDVALAGTWSDEGMPPVLAAFGPRYRNHVRYLGRFEREVLREHRTRQAFVADLRRGRQEYVILGRGRPPKREAREEPWVRALGYTLVAESPRLAVYRSAG